MRYLAFAMFAILAPVVAWGQQPPPPPPNVQALQQTVIELTGDKLDWRTQAITLQAQLADLQRQLAAAQAKPQEPPK